MGCSHDKMSYPSRERAVAAAVAMWREHGRQLYPYLALCGSWHLTHWKPRAKFRIRRGPWGGIILGAPGEGRRP